MRDDAKEVYLLTYDHGGYITWGYHFIERLESAIDWLQKYPKFKIGLDNESFTYDKYAKDKPEIMALIKKTLRQFPGRFAIGASTYGQPLSVFINEESNVRQLTYAIRTNLHHFNETPAVFAISEHALHAQTPQLLRQTGYKGAIMRTHFMMYGYNPTYQSAYGLWRGADGTQIPTLPTYEGQGNLFGATTMDNWILTRWPCATDQPLEAFVEKFEHITPLVGSRYDDSILRCEELTAHVETLDNHRWILLEELIDIMKDPTDLYQPTSNDFVVRMPWGYCGNKIFNDLRACEIQIALAERTNAASCLLGGAPMVPLLEDAWKNILITQHHDITICGQVANAEKYLGRAQEAMDEVLTSSLAHLASAFTTQDALSILVYNPHAFSHTHRLEREITLRGMDKVENIAVYLEDVQVPATVEVLDSHSEGRYLSRVKLRFAAAIPPLSLACFRIVPAEKTTPTAFGYYDRATGVLKTPQFTLVLDRHGIKSLTKGDATILNGAKGSLLAGVVNGQQEESLGAWAVQPREDSMLATYAGALGPIPFTCTFTLWEDRIDLHIALDHRGESMGTTEIPENFQKYTNGFVHETKVRLRLPTALAQEGRGVRDLPFLVEETQGDYLDKYVQGNYFTAFCDGSVGLALFNQGAMCTTREPGYLSVPLGYANEYVWGDRYIFGRYTHKLSLFPFVGKWQDADLLHRAIAYQFPLPIALIAQRQTGRFAHAVQLFAAAPTDNLTLSALYPEDGNIIARFYESAGTQGSLHLSSAHAHCAASVDLLGEPLAQLDGVVENATFAPHEIKSYQFALKQG